jgi:hypothetical protein
MDTSSKTVERRFPVRGISSAIMPIVGSGLGFLFLHFSPSGSAGRNSILYAIGAVLVSFLIGVILGIDGIRRRERPRIVAWIGLALNFGPLSVVILSWK